MRNYTWRDKKIFSVEFKLVPNIFIVPHKILCDKSSCLLAAALLAVRCNKSITDINNFAQGLISRLGMIFINFLTQIKGKGEKTRIPDLLKSLFN